MLIKCCAIVAWVQSCRAGEPLAKFLVWKSARWQISSFANWIFESFLSGQAPRWQNSSFGGFLSGSNFFGNFQKGKFLVGQSCNRQTDSTLIKCSRCYREINVFNLIMYFVTVDSELLYHLLIWTWLSSCPTYEKTCSFQLILPFVVMCNGVPHRWSPA
jgi:hypothetical protein